uniref:SRCR domain-containing protein n=1 Tax=Octopus bimaculoides TaxID=37653 RepID=A0A0L8H3P4_OCTBM
MTRKETIGNSTAGIVTVKSGSNWLHICYVESNSTTIATLTCQQMGFAFGSPLIVPNWLSSNSPVTLANCQGKETNLDQCKFDTMSVNRCKSASLFGVSCQGHI